MPATPPLRKSKRLVSRAQGPSTIDNASSQARLSTPVTYKVTRRIRSAPAHQIQKKIEDFEISDSDDPPTVEVRVFVGPKVSVLT